MFVSNAPPRDVFNVYKAGTNAGATASIAAVSGKQIYLNSIHGFTDQSTIIEIRNDLTGTLSTTSGDATVTGTGTSFTSELEVGQAVRVTDTSEVLYVSSITSDTEFEATANSSNNEASSAAVVLHAEVKPYYDDTWTADEALINYQFGGGIRSSKGKALDVVILASTANCAINAIGFTL